MARLHFFLHQATVLFLAVECCLGFASQTSTGRFLGIVQASSNTFQDSQTKLTVILPAFNESQRIGETLHLYHDYLVTEQSKTTKCDILVVNDGSTDETVQVVEYFSSKSDTAVPVQCLSFTHNQGKGAAIAAGVQHTSKGSTNSNNNNQHLILIADADASADIACLPALSSKLEELLEANNNNPSLNHAAMVVGKRTYNHESRSASRMILRWGFRTAVQVLCGDLGVSDTQCGFKLLTLPAAQQLYSNLQLQGWSHDVEVLYRAKQVFHIPVTEEAVFWQDKAGSKLVTSASGTIGASLQMLLEIAQLRLLYSVGIWK